MAKDRKIRRKSAANKAAKLTSVQEQRKIEKLLGEEFDSLAQARRALKKESSPVKEKPTPKESFNFGANKRKGGGAKIQSKPARAASKKGAAKPIRFVASKATRAEKFKQAQKIGKTKYYEWLLEWWDEHPDDDPEDNPYCYHSKE